MGDVEPMGCLPTRVTYSSLNGKSFAIFQKMAILIMHIPTQKMRSFEIVRYLIAIR